jgi:hypothetical protein
MENQTKISYIWIKEFNEHIKLDLNCTIPLNISDRMVYDYENKQYHLNVDFRVYVPESNSLVIVFKESK